MRFNSHKTFNSYKFDMLESRTESIAVEHQPLFRPSCQELEGLVITIDSGHGGNSHASGYAGSSRGIHSRVSEEHLNLLVAGQLKQYLVEAGAVVHLTHTGDEKVVPGDSDRATELGARTQKAADTASHLFLSLHHNWSDRPSANGVQLWLRPAPFELDSLFADILQEEIEGLVPHEEHYGHWQYEHPLVTSVEIPSVVVEFGFLTCPDFDDWVSKRGAHKIEALAAYNGIVRMWNQHRTALEEQRERLFPSAAKPSLSRPAIPFLPILAKQVWPLDRAPSTAEEINWILDCYKARALNDRTLFWMDVTAVRRESSWVLTGSVNIRQIREACELLLNELGLNSIVNEIRLLPEDSKLDNRIYGICQIPLAFTWGQPCEGVDVQSQLLLGERIHLLDLSDDGRFLLVHGQDGYVAWVHSEAILRLTLERFAEWTAADRALVVRETLVDDLRLPMGAALPLMGYDGDRALLRLPRGYKATGWNESAAIHKELIQELPVNITPGRKVVENAMQLLTTPYVFGGRGSLGIDCSGMTGLSYQANGAAICRDARQQIVAGQLVGTPWHLEDLKPGDLLYFTDALARVTHTGMSIGGYQYIHSSYPEVQISSLDPSDELYIESNAKRFCFAKRPYLD